MAMPFQRIERDANQRSRSNDMSIDPYTSPRPVPQHSKSSIPFLLNDNRPQSPYELYLPAPPRQRSAPEEIIHIQIDDDEVHGGSRESDNEEDDEESGCMYESDVAQPPNLPPISSILFTLDQSVGGSPQSSPMCSPRVTSATSSASGIPFGGPTSSESSSSSSPLDWLNAPPRSQGGSITHQQPARASWTQNGSGGSFRTQPTSVTTFYYPCSQPTSAPITRTASSGDTAASPSPRGGSRGISPAAMLTSFGQGAISHSAPSLLSGQRQHPNQNNSHQNMKMGIANVNTNGSGSPANSSPRGLASLRQAVTSVSSPSLLSPVSGAQSASASASSAFPSSLRGDKLHPQWVMTESRTPTNHSPAMMQSSPHSSPNPDAPHADPLGKRKRGRGSPGVSSGGDFTFLHLQVGNDGRLTMVKELN